MGSVAYVRRSASCAEHAIVETRLKRSHLLDMARRPRPQLVKLTDEAARRIDEIMTEKGAGYLRVGVKNGGCAGMEYVMDYVDAPAELDEVVEDNVATVVRVCGGHECVDFVRREGPNSRELMMYDLSLYKLRQSDRV